MSEGIAVDDDTMKFGLLMESAQAHQKLAQTHLERLSAHTRDLDDVVREEIRRTLVDELRSVTAETARASQALRDLRRVAQWRGALGSIGLALVGVGIPVAAARWILPSATSVAALEVRRDALSGVIASLEHRGGKVEWRYCGQSQRLCVRIDRRAPAYGEHADYLIVAGY